MKRNRFVAIFASIGLLAATSVAAQSVPAVGFPGHTINPNGQSAYINTNGYVRCLTGCQLGMPTPDTATLQALQYADSNGLPGVIYGTNGIKFMELCNLNAADPKSSVCMMYQANYSASNPRAEPANWAVEPGRYQYYVALDLCIQYYAPNGDYVGIRENWPSQQCGKYPYYVGPDKGTGGGGTSDPGPGTVPPGSCTGTHICNKDA